MPASGGKADSALTFLSGAIDVRFWPQADMLKNAIDVAIGGKADMTLCAAHVRF